MLWAQQSQLAFIYIYMYVRMTMGDNWAPEGKARVQNGVSGSFLGAVFEVVASKSQRSGQICHEVLSRETYYSSQVCRVCVALL